MNRRLLPVVLGCLATFACGVSLSSCGDGDGLRRAFEDYEAAVRPLMDKEAKVYKQLGKLLMDQQDKRYFRFLESDAKPFYEGFRGQVADIEPGDAQIGAAHDLLLQFSDARLEFVNGSLQVEELPKHLRRVEHVNEAEQLANAANQAYVEALGVEPKDARFTSIAQITEGFGVGFLRRLAAGEITREEVADRLTKHVLPSLEKVRSTKYDDDPKSQLLRDTVVGCQNYHRSILENLESIDAAFSSRRRTQHAVNRGDELLRDFLEELKRLRRLL